MSDEKPKDVNSYKIWLKSKLNVEISDRSEKYYESVTAKIKSEIEKSNFWDFLVNNLREYNDEYLTKNHYQLLREVKPDLLIKPFSSFIEKTYRKNVIENQIWPNPPREGWILPKNWFSRINDIVRTLIEVKYLDGVEFIIQKIQFLCTSTQNSFNVYLEAREEGYYAAHLYIKHSVEIPKVNWDTEKIDVLLELQITTQLQEVIRTLLHDYYEKRRQKPKDEIKWQWDYKSEEFAASYLGHILHYVEGMIVEIRDKQKEKKS